MAHHLDLALRHNGKNLIKMFKRNEKAFLSFVRENRADIRDYVKLRGEKLAHLPVELKEKVVAFLETQENNAQDIATIGQDVVEVLYEITADYSLYFKAKLTDFITKNYDVLKEESKSATKLVFHKLKLNEIAAFVTKSLSSVEEYLCIKESLSKLDLLTNRYVSEVGKKHILSE